MDIQYNDAYEFECLPLDPGSSHDSHSSSYDDPIPRECHIDLIEYKIRIHLHQFHSRICSLSHTRSLKKIQDIKLLYLKRLILYYISKY